MIRPGFRLFVALVVAMAGAGGACSGPGPAVPPGTAAASASAAGAIASPTSPTPSSAARPALPPEPRIVAAAITEAGLRADLEALAAATGTTPPHRAVGSTGYDAALDFVERELRGAGWTVSEDVGQGLAFHDEGGSTVTVDGRTYDAGDTLPLIFAPAGDVEGPVVAIDWNPSARSADGRGCIPTAYGTLPAHAIVLVRPGPCFRREQVIAAQEAGAAAFIAAYPWGEAGKAVQPTLIRPDNLEIPAASATRQLGDALAAAAASGGTARLVTHARTEPVATRSVIAELPGSQAGAVVMLGAHLDSVIAGPGINDDGSGVAALLGIARAFAGTRPRATIRLAFWTGEELGLHGSMRYALGLSDDARRAISVYLNVDMIASPNGYAGVYNELTAPPGSPAVQALLAAAVTRAGGTPVDVDLGGGSDHLGFAQAGIPTGGVFSGATEPLSPAQAAGAVSSAATVGRPADSCYHLACDDLGNADLALARVLAAGLADLTARLANNPELVRR